MTSAHTEASRLVSLVTIVRYAGGRLLWSLPTLVLVTIISFLLLHVAPGDLADVIAGSTGSASPEMMASLREQYGLDQPALVRFGHYLANLVQLNLGYSFMSNLPVLDLILSRIPATALLTLTSVAIALASGTLIGVLAAYNRGRWPDTLLSVISTAGFATPLFWIGLMLIFLFAVELRWLPTGGMGTVGFSGSRLQSLLDLLRHLILPAFTLSLFYLSIYARIVRASVIEVLDTEYVRTAEAKGLTRARIVIRHVLRNALLPLVTITGLEIGTLLSGTITIEVVFSWPGMGRLAYEAVTYRDVNLLMGILLMSAALIVIANLVLDLVYALIDPRITLK